MVMTRADAEGFAAQMLAWLAQDHARIGAFFGWSGENPADLRERLTGPRADPSLMLAIIEFVMLDEAMLLDACAALDVSPQTPMQARAALPGGTDLHWT